MRRRCIFDDPLQFLHICMHIVFYITCFLSIFAPSVCSYHTPLTCLSLYNSLFCFSASHLGCPNRTWREAEGDTKQHNPWGKRLRWPPCFRETLCWLFPAADATTTCKLQAVCTDIMCVCTLVKYVGGYHGLLSGVTVRPGSVEPHSVVECLYACREGLDFGDLETLGSGMKVNHRRAAGY